MVTQPAPDGQLVDRRDPDQGQFVRRPDTRQQQDLRALIRAGAEDHLPLGVQLGDLATVVDLNPGRGLDERLTGPVARPVLDHAQRPSELRAAHWHRARCPRRG